MSNYAAGQHDFVEAQVQVQSDWIVVAAVVGSGVAVDATILSSLIHHAQVSYWVFEIG
jgi:hypothetical protein